MHIKEINPFSLYVVFSHSVTPREATLGNSFFQVSSHARAHVRIICVGNDMISSAISNKQARVNCTSP